MCLKNSMWYTKDMQTLSLSSWVDVLIMNWIICQLADDINCLWVLRLATTLFLSFFFLCSYQLHTSWMFWERDANACKCLSVWGFHKSCGVVPSKVHSNQHLFFQTAMAASKVDKIQSNLGITTTEGTGSKWSYFSGGLICQVWFKKFQSLYTCPCASHSHV